MAYRRAMAGRVRTAGRADDIAGTRLVFRVEGLPALVERLQADGTAIVSKGVVAMEDGSSAALVRDPDGHLLELRARP